MECPACSFGKWPSLASVFSQKRPWWSELLAEAQARPTDALFAPCPRRPNWLGPTDILPSTGQPSLYAADASGTLADELGGSRGRGGEGDNRTGATHRLGGEARRPSHRATKRLEVAVHHQALPMGAEVEREAPEVEVGIAGVDSPVVVGTQQQQVGQSVLPTA